MNLYVQNGNCGTLKHSYIPSWKPWTALGLAEGVPNVRIRCGTPGSDNPYLSGHIWAGININQSMHHTSGTDINDWLGQLPSWREKKKNILKAQVLSRQNSTLRLSINSHACNISGISTIHIQLLITWMLYTIYLFLPRGVWIIIPRHKSVCCI